MKYIIEISTGNAAFADNESEEVARILSEVAEMIKGGHSSGINVLDYNGNRCGSVSIVRGVA